MDRKKVRIGIVGTGFIAETRARCYAQVAGYDAELVAVASRIKENADAFAHRHGIATAYQGHEKLFDREDIDLVDLCVPNNLHKPLAEAAAQQGKHIVLPKPLTAYVGQDLAPEAPEEAVSGRDPETMLRLAVGEAEAMMESARKAGVKLMYGENWIFSPSVERAESLMSRSGGTILEMRGGECHNGSHSPFSKVWKNAGGGALIRLGVHPIGAMIYLKRAEGIRKSGSAILPVAVSAEVGDLSKVPSSKDDPSPWIATGWKDVENWASLIITFSDGSRGIVYASDAVVGGMESRLEIFLSNGQFKCNLSPHDLLEAYAPEESVFGDAYIMEKASTTAGWSTPLPDEDWSSGHLGMCRNFVATVADDVEPKADASLGTEAIRVVYAGYLAAKRGTRVELAAQR